jgi:thioredoxin 2
MTSSSETIVCPSCGAINKAPAARLASGERPSCGGCHHPLFSGAPYDVGSDETFKRLIENTSIPVLVDFWAEWCRPCMQMAPHFKAAAQALEPHVRLIKVDTETLPIIAGRYGIRSIPTLILFSNGREIARESGVMQASAIEQWVGRQMHQA